MSCLNRVLVHISLLQVLPYFCHCLTTSQRQQILGYHNNLRRDLARGQHGRNISNINKLEWSEELESTAEDMVTCSRSRVNHDDPFSVLMYNYGKYRSLNIKKIMKFWTRERRHYVPEDMECIPWDGCLRYKAMVGAERQSVGCALKACPRRGIVSYALLCVYRGGGNLDSFRYKAGPVCTQCKDNQPFCDNGLCVKCTHSGNRTCECAKTCQRENVGVGTLNRATCTCECTYGLGPNCDQPCKNPEIYYDYDYCATVTREDCNEPDVYMSELLRESCPEQCVCRKHPNQD